MASQSSALPLETDVRSTAAKLKTADNFLLLDCREPAEYALVHIDGTLLLPMSELAARASELENYRGHEIVVHCHHGGRSLKVTRWLREQGFPHVQSMSGGIDAWSLEIDPSLQRYQ